MKTAIALAASLTLAASATHAQTYSFASALSPEVTGATGTGSVLVDYDVGAQTLDISAIFFGLSGTTTVAHIHCCTAAPNNVGVAVTPGTLPGFPVGSKFGFYQTTLDLTQASTYTASFITNFGGGTVAGASSALLTGLNAGTAYFNVHTNAFPGGEIRGFLQPVPEPGTWALMGLGLAAVGGLARRRAAVKTP
jgi:hypothetical protein